MIGIKKAIRRTSSKPRSLWRRKPDLDTLANALPEKNYHTPQMIFKETALRN
jgi:hypothetical protein